MITRREMSWNYPLGSFRHSRSSALIIKIVSSIQELLFADRLVSRRFTAKTIAVATIALISTPVSGLSDHSTVLERDHKGD